MKVILVVRSAMAENICIYDCDETFETWHRRRGIREGKNCNLYEKDFLYPTKSKIV